MDKLTRPERKALSSFRTQNDIIIKQADKGSATVVMSKEDYMTKVMQHLKNEQHYCKLDEDPTKQYAQEITFLTDMVNSQVIDKDGYTCNYLHPSDTRTLILYVLPKIRKPGNPEKPIVLSCGSPTERFSNFVDFYLNSLVKKTPPYIKDTTHFVSKRQKLNNLPPNVLLVTLDVTSL